MGYESWPSRSISPISIDLDPKNPRLPGLTQGASQAEIREEMFEAGRVRDMVKSIAKSGYYPDQGVVVIEHPEKSRGYIVIEGNRRICACQALLRENRVPDAHARFIKRWREAAEPVSASYEKVPIVIAPSREAATHLIVSRHLSKAPVRPWSRFAQGKFAINQLNEGQDIEYISDETGLSEADIRKNIREYRLIEMFVRLDWNEQERAFLLDNIEKFPIETVSRVLKSQSTKSRFGEVSFQDDGWPIFKWDEEKIPLFLKRLVRDTFAAFVGASKPLLNSRSANSQEDVAAYLDTLPEEICPRPARKKTSAEKIVKPAVDDVDAGAAEAPPKKKHRQSRKVKRITPTLPPDIECTIKHDKARALLEELQEVTPEVCTHGAALVLRTLLEISLVARMKEVKTWGECVSKYQKSKDQLPSLKQLIDFTASSENTIPDENLRKAIRDDRFAPRKFLNLVAHNDKHVLTATDVRDVAARMTPLLRYLLGHGIDGHGE